MDDALQATQHVKNIKSRYKFRNAKEGTANYCDGILNFEPGMMLGQNLRVFIVFGTVTPSIRKSRGCLKNHLQ